MAVGILNAAVETAMTLTMAMDARQARTVASSTIAAAISSTVTRRSTRCRMQFVVRDVAWDPCQWPAGRALPRPPRSRPQGPTGRSRDPVSGGGQAARPTSSSPSIVHRRDRWR